MHRELRGEGALSQRVVRSWRKPQGSQTQERVGCGEAAMTPGWKNKGSASWVPQLAGQSLWSMHSPGSPNVRASCSRKSQKLILLYCGVTTATFYVRSVRPDLTENFAEPHDEQVWRCFCELVGVAQVHQQPASEHPRVSLLQQEVWG